MDPSPPGLRLRERFAASYAQLLEIAHRVAHRRTAVVAHAKVTPTEVLHDAFVELDREEHRRMQLQRSLLGERPETLLRACVGAACRDALVARLRELGRQKRGGMANHEPVHSQMGVDDRPYDTLAVHDAIEAIRKDHPDLAELIELRYFSDLSIDDCAHLLGASPRSVDRDLALAKAMLRKKLE